MTKEKYGHDESAPTPGGVFRSYFVGVCGYFTVCLLGYHNPLVTLWQTVSSRRGPIYRARISVNAHKMGNRNAFAMKRICVFDNVEMCLR